MLVATPSGLALAPEGGAHQSVGTPLIGLAQDGLAAFEPAFVDELAAILRWSFDYMQRDGSGHNDPSEWLRDVKGGSVYLRLSTRTLAQPERNLDGGLREQIIAGGYWLKPPAAGSKLAIVAMGAVMPEALEAHAQLSDEMPGWVCSP
jgi:pyruvate dehydrogenase E1 component